MKGKNENAKSKFSEKDDMVLINAIKEQDWYLILMI